MRWLIWVVVFVLQVACAQVSGTQPAAGAVRYSHEVREGPPRLHLHVVTVDLTDPAVSLVVRPGNADPDGAGPWQTTLRTVRSTAEREGMIAAVNGDFFIPKDARQIMGRRVPYFDGNWAKAVGRATSDGKTWALPTQAGWAALAVSPGNRVAIVVDPVPVPRDATEVVGGSAAIVVEGKAVPGNDAPAPRTAAGVDRAGKTLVLLVVDGRRPEYSAGLTLGQLGAEMVRLGCWNAINLDGGGSSTMVAENGETGMLDLKNRPSDGHDFLLPLSVERPVANVLGVKVKGRVPATRPAATRPK